MAENVAVERLLPLAGRQAASPGVTIMPLPPAARLSLRARSHAIAAAGKALGLNLPVEPMRSVTAGTRSALWLGPDEWLIIDEGAEMPADLFGRLKWPVSAVDISHRNTAIEVAGPAAEATLSSGCPLDLAPIAFPVGKCTRTVLGKAEIVLWRTGAETFRVECWRSFAEYVFSYLSTAARDAAF
jgi:sarcosine oxidase subunit gamma